MANKDRAESFSKIMRWLDKPKPQTPNPDRVLSQMLVEEQLDLLKLTNTRQAWGLVSYVLNTVSGQSEYTINSANLVGGSNLLAGKVYHVIRATGDDELPYLSISYDDFDSLDYGKMPPSGEVNDNFAIPEKISFYRLGIEDQIIKAVISPTPQEVLNYTIYFYPGSFDRLYSLMSEQSIMTEIVDYRDIRTALKLLPYAEWSGLDRAGNDAQAARLAAGLQFQYSEQKPVVDEYIRQINSPRSFDLDAWDE